ncbi:MAG: efflux transporter outer membrane subunit [Candidatus Omnitrophica bacterium]|nr:efflux transporter outer membrane subunit [Candidatus Omnitrophota bacterium]MDD5738252.1 efflux transporter outer membrane subunit [Candidatus Omnitrophota bacterium]
MKKIWIYIIACIMLPLSGCSLAPKYTRPAAPVPAEFPSGDAYLNGDAKRGPISAENIKWQDAFPDKKLQQVIELSLLNNRDLKLAVLNVERARAYYGVQAARLYPAVTASAGGTDTHVPAELSSTGDKMTYDMYNVDLGIVSWEVDLFGRIRSLKKQALEEYLGTEEAQRGAQTALIGEVARAYITLAADLERLKLARATFETQQNVYGLISKQYEMGIVAAPDLLRSQTQVDTARGDIARFTKWVAQDRNALDFVVGLPVPEDLLPSGLGDISPIGDISPGLSSEVLLRRPDIMTAEHRLKASYAFIGAARAAFFPRISLTTAVGSASGDLSNLFSSSSKTWTFASQAAMPIFDTRIRAAYNVSKAERDITLVQYEKTIQTAFREVADVLAVMGTIDQQVEAQGSVVDSAQKIYSLTRERYIQGIDGYLSVLDAQRTLYGAQQELTSLQLVKMANQVRLYAVLGGDGAAN